MLSENGYEDIRASGLGARLAMRSLHNLRDSSRAVWACRTIPGLFGLANHRARLVGPISLLIRL